MSLFNLSPLKERPPSLPQLSPSKAQFTLPPLDERAPGVERLLGSLREGLLIAAAHEVPFDSRPKETSKGEEAVHAAPVLDDHPSEDDDEEGSKQEAKEQARPATEQDLWAQAALAGPSRLEVSCTT